MDDLFNLSDMFIGQIVYSYSRFFMVKQKLEEYTLIFNQYINNNYDYMKEDSNIKGVNCPNNNSNTNEYNKMNGESTINEVGVRCAKSDNGSYNIGTRKNQVLKTNNSVKNYPIYDTEAVEKNNTKKILMNKMYKNLARKCHPDRISNIKLNFYFVESQKALRENNLGYLIFLSHKANIGLNIDSEIYYVQQELALLDRKLINLTNKIEWKWCSVKNDGLKTLLINQYIISNKMQKKNHKPN